MRVLFLDDSRLRHGEFARRHADDVVVQVFTAAEAIRALDELERFDLVHLDHDLAEEHYLELSGGERETAAPGDPVYDPGTGMDVVDHILTTPVERRPVAVVVHTHNPLGAEMQSRLARAGIPASWVRF